MDGAAEDGKIGDDMGASLELLYGVCGHTVREVCVFIIRRGPNVCIAGIAYGITGKTHIRHPSHNRTR